MTEEEKPQDPRPAREADPVIAVVLGWAIPGAGHFYIGRRDKAALFFVLIMGTFLAGLFLSDFACISYKSQPYWFVGQVFAGLATLITAILNTGGPGPKITESLEVGILYTTIASLLNFLVILNALAETRGFAPEDKKAEDSEPAPDADGEAAE